MAKLVQKSGYIQNGSGAANYMKYIATREGVEILPGLFKNQKFRCKITGNESKPVSFIILSTKLFVN